MLVPLSWLKEYIKINLPTEKLAEKLLLSGTKVEETKNIGKEVVLNLEITPNRPDTLSVYGVAREAAVVTDSDLLPLDTNLIVPRGNLKTTPTIKVTEKKLMPAYTLALIGEIKVKPSPDWLAERLEMVGIRPINNIVDITNYVMHETGQPMHAFDYDKIEGELSLRASKEGEVVKTLDGIERKLPAGAIIIEDSKKLVDLAGLMGGENSEIDEKSTKVLLHVPLYDPVSIRRTSQYLGLRTEASNRFEKKLDPAGHLLAFERALKLLTEIAGARLFSEPRSISQSKELKLDLELSILEEFLGLSFPIKDVMNILSNLGFQVQVDPFKEGFLQVVVPTWRTDIEASIDLVEEIGRIWGYNRFPKTLPTGEIPQHPDSFEFDWEGYLVKLFISSQFNQTTTHTLLSEETLKNVAFDPKNSLRLSNPMSEDFEYLRPSLIPELLKAISKNQSLTKKLEFFEIGRIFSESSEVLPNQPKVLSFVTTESFAKAKGLVEAILAKTDFDCETKQTRSSLFSSQIDFLTKGGKLAEVGKLEKTILNNLEIEGELIAGTIFFEAFAGRNLNFHYEPLAKYPPVIEDISMFVDKETEAGKILDLIRQESLVKDVHVFDVYPEEKRKSIGVRITFQSPSKTLTDSEVAKVREKISNNLEKRLKAQIRRS